MDHQHRIGAVLGGVSFPARTSQLLAQADAYGDAQTRTELGRLPVGMYANLDAVLTAPVGHPRGGPHYPTRRVSGT
jgi:hypothetical protein